MVLLPKKLRDHYLKNISNDGTLAYSKICCVVSKISLPSIDKPILSIRVAMRPIVDRMTGACENITFPCGRLICYWPTVWSYRDIYCFTAEM